MRMEEEKEDEKEERSEVVAYLYSSRTWTSLDSMQKTRSTREHEHISQD